MAKSEPTINLVLDALVRRLETIARNPDLYWAAPRVHQQLPLGWNAAFKPALIVTAPDYATDVRILGGDIVDAGPFDVQVWGLAQGTIDGDGERNAHRLMRDVLSCLAGDRTLGGVIQSGIQLPKGYHFDLEASAAVQTVVAVMTVTVRWEHAKANP